MKVVSIGVPVKKKIPPWKNRSIIDSVKADFIDTHNKKIRELARITKANTNDNGAF